MGKMWLGPKASLNVNKDVIRDEAPKAKPEAAVQPQPAVQVIKEIVERPVEVIREVIVEVPVIKEIIVERKEEVPVIKEVIKEVVKVVEVPVEIIKEVEVEKIVRIPVVEIRKEVPAWVRAGIIFEVVKYAAVLLWLALK